jgi:hypothetical protein
VESSFQIDREAYKNVYLAEKKLLSVVGDEGSVEGLGDD